MEGMWALAIYDKKKKEIVISRDRFSEKPLYYYTTKEGLYFSSDVKAITVPDSFAFNNSLKIALKEVNKSYYKKPEETFFEKIKNLPLVGSHY